MVYLGCCSSEPEEFAGDIHVCLIMCEIMGARTLEDSGRYCLTEEMGAQSIIDDCRQRFNVTKNIGCRKVWNRAKVGQVFTCVFRIMNQTDVAVVVVSSAC